MINKIEQQIIKFINERKLLAKGDKVLVAFSGGPDSVFLLYFLNKFKRKFQIKIGAIHVNHKFRGKDADKDEEFCRDFCKRLGLEFFSVSKNIRDIAASQKISFEEAGREFRYFIFQKLASEYKFTKIATAHNSNDNAETVLLNLIKGSGIKGISGIPIIRENIIRPILFLSKAEILDYLDQNKLKFRIDKTNLNVNYERNFLRNGVIPLIQEKLNPSLENSIFNSSDVFKKISSLIDKKIEPFLKTVEFNEKDKHLKIFRQRLEKMDEELLGDFLREAVKRNFSIQLSFKDFDKLISLFHSKTGTKINLSENFSAVKEREEILLYLNKKTIDFIPIKIRVNYSAKLNEITFAIKEVSRKNVRMSKDRHTEYISADRCGEEFIIREWKKGDRFYPIGMKNIYTGRQGSKKVSDFLNEQKIPSFLKKKQLVLTSKNKIVWVMGLRLDDRFKLKKNTKKIYRLCLK